MARITLKSQAIVIAQLEAQVAELATEKGILLSQLEERNQQVKLLNDEVECLKQSYDQIEAQLIDAEANKFTRDEVNQLIELEVADRMATKPPASPKKPAPKPLPSPAQVESAPVIQITDADRDVYRKFNALPREQRLTIINWARPKFGHIGMHNIQAVRAAWHEFNNPTSCADEANLADIA